MIGVTFTTAGQSELLSSFDRAIEVFENSRPELETIGEEVFLVIRRRFDAEGPGWPKLTSGYAARKAKRFGSKTILRASDHLYGSFEKGAADNVFRVDNREAEFGTVDPVGTFHHEGRGFNPERKIIDMTSTDEAGFGKIMFEGKSRRLRALGFQVN